MASLTRFIEKRLKLKVNADKSKVAKPHERSFLSFKLWRLKQSGKVLVMIADKALRLVNDKLKAQTPRNWGQSLDECIRRVNVYLRGWLGYFATCDKKQLAGLGRIGGHLRRRLRTVLLRLWTRKRHIVRQLVELEVPPPLARVDINVGRRSWWALSDKRAVQRGLTNAYFDRRGLYTLHAHWQEHHERIWNIGPEPPKRQTG